VSCAVLAEYGRDYCVVDTHNLFVGTTLEDEILLLGADDALAAVMVRECAGFELRLESGRKLSSYSGGEQSIICCLLLMILLPNRPLRVLLVHVLETLSPRNRESLLVRFAALLPAARLFSLTPDGPQPLPDHV
jgi:hypothetical protein